MTKPLCTYPNCHDPAYGHGMCRTHYPLWTPAHSEYKDKVLERREWPKGAKPDELKYRLAVSQNVVVEYVDGEFIETPFSENYNEKPQFREDYIGTYAQISLRAAHLNKIQGREQGWCFYPEGPLEMAAA